MTEAVWIALIGACVSLMTAVVPKIMDNHYGIGKDIKEIKSDVSTLKDNDKKNGDMIYTMLSHMATGNESGEMKRALNEYNEYFRHN